MFQRFKIKLHLQHMFGLPVQIRFSEGHHIYIRYNYIVILTKTIQMIVLEIIIYV